MIVLLIALLIAIPLAELAVFIQVSQWVGVLEAIALLLAISLGGALLVRQQGLGVLTRMRGQLSAGSLPGNELIDGAVLLVAGVLLLVPGFISDAIGLLLLLPISRALVRARVKRRFGRRIRYVTSARSRPSPPSASGPVLEIPPPRP